MLKVSDLLSLLLFETFELITNPDGLNNIVGGSSVLEWETEKEIATDFAPNDFVMTTLYMYRDDLSRADSGLKALIKRRVAAIAIKTTFTDTCSQEVIDLANLYKIPIFRYKDAFLEDLIFTIESSVFADNSNNIALDYLKYMLETSDDKVAAASKKLNPLFLDNLMCFCLIPTKSGDQSTLDEALASYRKAFPTRFPVTKSSDSFIRCKGCLLYIYTSEQPLIMPLDIIQSLQLRFGVMISDFCIGYSSPKASLSQTKTAVSESLIAAVSASMEKEGFRAYSQTGSDAVLLPFLNRREFNTFYNDALSSILTHDERYNSGLIDTLIIYVESDGDINLTAKRMFQHPNTIRHRIDKLKDLLKTTSTFDMHIQFFLLSRIHKVYDLFGNESLI